MGTRYTKEEKTKAMEMVHRLGVRGTAKATGIPVGTLSSWRTEAKRRGENIPRPPGSKYFKHWPPRTYTDDFKRMVVGYWKRSRSRNRLKATAEYFEISTKSLRRWIILDKEGRL